MIARNPGRAPAILLAVVVTAALGFGAWWLLIRESQPPLAERLRDAVRIEAIMDGLRRLQTIADANGGTRAGGTQGQLDSARYVADELRAAGYEVAVDTFDLPLFTEVGAPTVSAGGRTYTSGVDFRPMIFSASGHLTAPLVAVGFDPARGPDAGPSPACSAEAFAGVPPDAVLLVQGGGCFTREIVDNATAAGASGLIVSYASWSPGAVLRPTLRTPDVGIPVLAATGSMGLGLDAVAGDGGSATLDVETSIVDAPSANVIAETPGGDPGAVVMLGGHLDSVIDGPGIQDNGSGTMTILEIARQAIRLEPRRRVRVAFWTGEEIGLYGSERYVRSLSPDALGAIEAYLNFDMLGSPNGARIVYDDAGAADGSARIRDAFVEYFAGIGLASVTEDLSFASDHAAFETAGVPTGGLFSGASTPMSAEEAQLFGGRAGVPFDACYHFACDTFDNVNPALLEELARAAASVTGRLAAGDLSTR